MGVIRAAHYGETEARLKTDPVVLSMAADLVVGILGGDVDTETFTDSGGGPNHSFMLMANSAYRAKGGTDGGHLGAVPTAVLEVVQDTMCRLAEAALAKYEKETP